MALLIEPSGSKTVVSDIHSLWYDGVRDMIGGPAEIVELDDGRALIVNEEFKLLNLPLNVEATSLLQEKLSKLREGIDPRLAPELSTAQTILGPAILVDASELKQIKEGG